MVEWWMVTMGALAVMVVCYSWLAAVMIKGIVVGRQWRSNPVAVATAAVFVTCTIGHAVHIEHAMLAPVFAAGASTASTVEAVRVAHADPVLLVWHVFTAGIAVWYLSMRSRLQVVHGGQALCEDMAAKQSNAMAIHDQVMASLGRAQVALEAGDRVQCGIELDEGLAASKQVITDLLGEPGHLNALGPGDLRRQRPSGG